MEKFGIFELLDALAAVTEAVPPEKTPPKAPDPRDAAFRAPAYGTDGTEEAGPASGTDPRQSAYDGFLSRHDAIVKKIGGKK